MELDDRELYALAADLGKVSGEMQARLRGTFQEGASDLKKEWQANAKESSGAHGHLYPYSIDWDQVSFTALDFEVGPNESKSVKGGQVGKAGVGYEFGSVNQPPHLDGQRAADKIIPLLERRIAITADDVFGDVL